jgi:putative tryptophan/tyrosine transport system substrate-binding protein
MATHIRRRELVFALGGAAAAWPLAARAQQPALPVIGFLNSSSSSGVYARMLVAFRQGLNEAGYIEGRNVTIEYRWAEGQSDRLPELAGDLVGRKVTVIAATTTQAALAAKAATATIPVVFEMAGDPVQLGIIAALNRPGGNVTGVTNLNIEVTPKRLELLHEVIPTATTFALLINPSNPTLAEPTTRDIRASARTLGVQLHVVSATTDNEIDDAFASLTNLRAGGLVIGGDQFFSSRIERLASLAVRYAVPAIYLWREFAVAGGLMSYGSQTMDAYRLTGIYVGRVLNGEKPADLPVQQATKVELYINLKTAKTLGITIPLSLSGRADVLIE